MKFTAPEITKALELKRLGLDWTPGTGCYVWDEAGIIQCESPFHDLVYYILDLKHFLRRADSVEQLKRDLCWLPTWYDARRILQERGVTQDAIIRRLQVDQAIENGTERMSLYQMIEENLKTSETVSPKSND